MIKKIDKDTFEIITETKETVSLSQLEDELENLKKLKQEIDEFNKWVDTLPPEKQKFIIKQNFAIPNELIEKISILKNIN